LKAMQKLAVIEGDLIDQVEREIQVQLPLKHENIVRLYMHFEDTDTVYLLLEYCAKGELYQLLRTRRGRRFTEDVARHYFVQVARGLRYLHSQCIVHRDLKPENLLVNADDVLKIADFGWCAYVSGANRTTFCGTLDYLAPEMVLGLGHNHTVDIWSLGVLLYEMVVGRTPFQSTNHVLLIHKILSTELRFPPFVPRGVSDLVTRLLQHNAQERMPLEMVLRHPWTTGSVDSSVQSRERPRREPSPLSPVRTQASSMPPRQQLTNKASSRAASLSNDGATIALAQKPHHQASPRDGRCTNTAAVGLAGRPGDKQGRCGSRPERGSELLQQQQQKQQHHSDPQVSTLSASGLAARQVGALQSSMGRAHAQSTSAMPGCRAPAALQASTGSRHMQGTQGFRHNHSAPQTPVQQAPFRHVRSAGGVVSSRRFSGGGVGSTTATTSTLTATTADGCRPSRRESPGSATSPVRRPRSSGPSESQADLTNSRSSATQATVSGVSTNSPKVRTARPHSTPTLSGPAAPPTPTNLQQMSGMAHSTAASQNRLQHRVSTASGGYQIPGSPKPCSATAGRSLSPLGSQALQQTFAGQRSAPIAGPRIAPGMALLRRA
jgi:serine/threonine protein kinase